MKAALLTPFLHHLPLHPSSYLAYGTAILKTRYDIDVIDLNADIYFKNRADLTKTLSRLSTKPVVVDTLDLYPLYHRLLNDVKKEIIKIPWHTYQKIFITTPSWFVTIPTEDILKTSKLIKKAAPTVELFFFSNSLGSWTDEKKLAENNIHILHLNDLFKLKPVNTPVDFDALPTPQYENRKNYIFDLLPFRLKHGCIWGKCRFCSLAKGWNAGYKERSAKKAYQEIQALITKHNPQMLVCRDNSINGANLIEFCNLFEHFKKPWVAMGRADLSNSEIIALQKAGCRFIYFGLESGSDRVLNDFNKGIRSKQISEFIKTLHDRGIMPAPSCIVGAPDENRDDFEKTKHFILEHQKYLDIINVYPLRQTPGSDFTTMKIKANRQTQNRLNEMIEEFVTAGLRVFVGEQSAEYVLLKKVYPGPANY
jgi:hypothetical protein